MQYYEFIACRNDTGAALPLGKATVYLTGTSTLATLYDIAGAGLSNPLTATVTGLVGFAAANGAYDIQLGSADGTYLSPMIHDVQLYDLSQLDANIAKLKSLTIRSDRSQIKYDGTGTASPSTQTTTFTAVKISTTATVTWSLTDLAGNPVTPVTSYLSAATGDTVTMARTAFDSARGSTLGVIATGTLTDGTTFTGSTTIVANQDGAAGTNGTTGSHLTGQGVPAPNVGANGDDYTDTVTGITYGQKTGGKWPLGTVADVNAATPTRFRADFRIAGMTFPTPHFTFSRAGARTDMLYTDDYTYSPTTFATGVPMIRPGLGLGVFMPATQLLANPGAPTTETLTLNGGGTYIATAWGPAGSAQGVSLGTATATITKFSTGSAATSLGGNEKTFLIIVVTGTGTVTFAPSGGLTKANVVLNSSSPGSTQPVPYIASQTTIPGDLDAGTSTFNALIGASQGYFIVGISATFLRSYANPSPLGLNGASAVYLSTDTQYVMYDGAHSSSGLSIGNAKFSTGAVLGRTWDATATVDNGAGDSRPYSFGFQHNNGAAVTSSALGVAATTGSFANFTQINGFIGFYEIDTTARLSTTALYSKYSSWAPPASSSVLHNFAPTSLAKWKRGLAQMAAGVRDCTLCIVASSHGAGQYPTTDAKRNSWPWQLATKLTAAGIQAWPYAYCGNDQYAIPGGGGTSVYDPYVSFSAGWSQPGDRNDQFGGNYLQTTTTGATMTHAIPVATDTHTFVAYQGSGYGTFTITANGGAVLATINLDNPTAAEKSTTVSIPAGVNSVTLTVTSTGSKPVKIARSIPNDSRFKKVMIYNGARSAANSTDLSNNVAVENSYLLGLTNLAPDLTIIQGPVTNAAGASETAATFTANMTSVYNTAAASGSVLMMDDPASSVSSVTLANQTLYRNLDATIAYDKGVPFLSAYEISTYELGNARGLWGDAIHYSPLGNGIEADNVLYALTTTAAT